jgi:hypothetical protein
MERALSRPHFDDLRLRSYISPTARASAHARFFLSAPLELKLSLGRRAGWRGLDPGARQFEMIEDLGDGLATRDRRYPAAL